MLIFHLVNVVELRVKRRAYGIIKSSFQVSSGAFLHLLFRKPNLDALGERCEAVEGRLPNDDDRNRSLLVLLLRSCSRRDLGLWGIPVEGKIVLESSFCSSCLRPLLVISGTSLCCSCWCASTCSRPGTSLSSGKSRFYLNPLIVA